MGERRTSVAWSIPTGTGEDVFRTLSRTFSGRSNHDDDRYQSADEEREIELEIKSDNDSDKTQVGTWKLAEDVKDFSLHDPAQGRKLGVTWKDLTVKVVPSDAIMQENFVSQFNIPQQIKEARHKPASCSG
jgi:hypothetical protein